LQRGYQTVIYLRYYLDVPTNECAETLGIAPGTVKSRLSRGLQQLQEIIQQDYPELVEDWKQHDDQDL
jgi:RNA polymerase sigma-70 factor (ECF subfamily)